MKLFPRLAIAVTLLTLTATAQDNGNWRAASKTATSITGDIAFAGQKIYINFNGFTVAQIRSLTPAEVSATFDLDTPATTPGNLYRTDISAAKKFLHKNTLCGSEDTQWIATWASNKTLHLAFFSGPDIPTFTPEAMSSSTTLCGTYTYVR